MINKKVNEKTIVDKYSLPYINDTLDKLGRCLYFSTLELASGFHKIELAKEDLQITAFNVENVQYEFLRIPFELNIPRLPFSVL